MEIGDRPSKRQRNEYAAGDENGAPSVKRVSRACDSCRSKKNRCDGGRPSCSTCTRIGSGLECTYSTQAKKRGFPTGYVRVLEALWALTFKAVPAGEQTILALLKDSAVGYDDDEKLILQNRHFDTHESPRAVWEKSSVRAEIERLVSNLEASAGVDLRELPSAPMDLPKAPTPLPPWTVRQTSHPAAETVLADVPNHPRFHKTRYHLLTFPPEYTDSDATAQIMAQSNPQSFLGTYADALSSFPTDAWGLIDMYFKFNNCCLPIIPKHEVVRILSSVQDGSGSSRCEVALLWAIFAMTSAQNQARSHTDLGERLEKRSDHYYRQASIILPTQYEEFRLEHVQICLLLTMVDMAKNSWEEAYLLAGKAVRILLLLRPSSRADQNITRRDSSSIPGPTFSLLLAACFALDTMISAHLNILPHLRTHDIENDLEFDNNGAEEWNQWSTSANNATDTSHFEHQPVRALSTFKAYVKLLALLNDICCGIHSQARGFRQTNGSQYLDELDAWRTRLPKHCRMDSWGTSQTTKAYLPPVVNLHLTFEAVMTIAQAAEGSYRSYQTAGRGFPPSIENSRLRWLYEEVLGSCKWDGILHFHERALEAQGEHSLTKDSDVQALGINIQHSAGLERLDSPLVEHSISLRRFEAPSTILSPGSLPQTLIRNFSLDQSEATHLGLAGAMGESSTATFDPMQISPTFSLSAPQLQLDGSIAQVANPTNFAAGDVPYDGNLEEDTIESLLEELSATQGSDWNEISSQFMYNLGFTKSDTDVP